MCTVTYVPIQNGFILTSSRDEKVYRATLLPKEYVVDYQTLIYPKDQLAEGTWISHSSNKRIACLLNGGFENHIKQNQYRKSRGLVLLESFNYYSIDSFISSIDLDQIEPFTLLLIDYNDECIFKELIWDGEIKHVKEIDSTLAKIWSSSTLYSKEDKNLRISWFENWLIKNRNVIDNNIFQFHNTKHHIISTNDIIVKREDDIQTVSISQIYISKKGSFFKYYNFLNEICTLDLQ